MTHDRAACWDSVVAHATRLGRGPRLLLVAWLGVAAGACGDLLTSAPDDGDLLDAPLEGLLPDELAAFVRGDEEFGRAFSPADGLGPLFNNVSCAGCHSGDGRGRPEQALVRFGEAPDFARELGGPQLQDRAIGGAVAEQLPEGLPFSVRLPPPVFGVGLIEAIPDATILALADPFDADGDGISGRAHLVTPPDWIPPDQPGAGPGPVVGRFSRKAQVAGLFQQVVEAYHQDMGVTSDFLPVENVNPRAVAASHAADRASDPEVPAAAVHAVIDYIRMLAPPRAGRDSPEVARGRSLFAAVGCVGCHVPVLRTSRHRIPVLASREVELYSDLLLHDLGDALSDGRADGDAAPGEWRTAPLWGLRVVRDFLDGDVFLLHDGRARTVEEAIDVHGGEAAAVRAAFVGLSPADRSSLVRFVESR